MIDLYSVCVDDWIVKLAIIASNAQLLADSFQIHTDNDGYSFYTTNPLLAIIGKQML